MVFQFLFAIGPRLCATLLFCLPPPVASALGDSTEVLRDSIRIDDKQINIVVDSPTIAQPLSMTGEAVSAVKATEPPAIVVTANRRRRLMETAQSIAIIRSDEWAGTNKSIADVIAEQTGVQTRRFGGIGSFQTVSIRGVEGSEVLVLIDGMPLNSALGGAVDLGKISPSRFSRIEVYRGFIPARLGGNGLGGVIDLITAKPAGDKGGDIHVSVANYHSQEHRILASHAAGERLLTLGLLSYIDSENDFPYLDRNKTTKGTLIDPTLDDTRRAMINNQYTAGHLLLHPTVRLGGGRLLHATFSATRFKAHQPGYEGTTNRTAYNAERNLSVNVRLDNESPRGIFSIEPALGYLFRGAYRFSSSLDSSCGASHSSSIKPNGFTEIGSDEQSVSAPIAAFFRPRENLRLESALTFLAADINPTLNTTGGSHGDWHSREASASFALDAVYTAGPVGLISGGSIKEIYSETDGGLDGYSNRTVLSSDTMTKTWSAKGGFSLDLAAKTLLLYCNAGRFSNHPSLRQRYGAQGAHNPNPTLVPETGLAGEVGLKYQNHAVFLELCGFYNRSRNKILTVFDGSQSGSINCGGAKVYGIETSFIRSIHGYVQIDSRATLQHTENLSREYNWYGKRLPGEPAIDINETITIGPFKGISLRYGVDLKSFYYRDPGNTPDFRVPKHVFPQKDDFWEVFHNCKLEWKALSALTVAIAGNRLTNDLLLIQETSYTGEGGYQWVLCPANQACLSLSYSF